MNNNTYVYHDKIPPPHAAALLEKTRQSIQHKLLKWFAQHQRNLPWRVVDAQGQRNPYHVWLAEIMLQQTQVATVIPYFLRWVQQFSSIEILANADLAEVMKAWEGLGYYSRVQRLHQTAKQVHKQHNGRLPETTEALLKLPGIGRYTAGAIASLAFGQASAAVDGNVQRVLSRLFMLAKPTDWPNNQAKTMPDLFWQIAEWLLPPTQADAFNEAWMDLGSSVCTPKQPACTLCPLQTVCQAQQHNVVVNYPPTTKRKATPHQPICSYIVLDQTNRILLGQRPENGLLASLWELVSFPLEQIPTTPTEANQAFSQHFGKMLLQTKPQQPVYLGQIKHAFTHFKITRYVYLSQHNSQKKKPFSNSGNTAKRLNQQYQNMRWCTQKEIAALALPRSDQKILALYRTWVETNQQPKEPLLSLLW